MSIARGFTVTVISGLGFSIVGALAGYSLGEFAPDYYRTVFRMPSDMPIDLAQAGMGLGATQGAAAGLFVGLVIVVAVAWYQSRREGSRSLS